LTYAIAIAKRNDIALSDDLIKKSYKSVNFLYQCQDLASGKLSNYGSNDGALFFKLNSTNYRDFRPQLDALYYLITGNNLYQEVYEDRYWFCGTLHVTCQFPKIQQISGFSSFENGGIYLIREKESLTMLVCNKYKDRPAHADGLHLDIWYKGENILFDGGSYKYNTSEELKKYFTGSESHNTVMLDNYDQMLKGPRFIWLNWINEASVEVQEDNEAFTIKSEINAYSYLDEKIRIKREIIKYKNNPEWEIRDSINFKPVDLFFIQRWHTNNSNIIIKSSGTLSEKDGFVSDFYGIKKPCNQLSFCTQSSSIKTTIFLDKK